MCFCWRLFILSWKTKLKVGIFCSHDGNKGYSVSLLVLCSLCLGFAHAILHSISRSSPSLPLHLDDHAAAFMRLASRWFFPSRSFFYQDCQGVCVCCSFPSSGCIRAEFFLSFLFPEHKIVSQVWRRCGKISRKIIRRGVLWNLENLCGGRFVLFIC